MIVRSIEVAGWRCFLEPTQIGPFGNGLNVVHGANGAGKSSLFMALGRGLFDDHSSSAESIKQLRPWGRNLVPRVTIEFEHNGGSYRLEKQFLDSKQARLSRLEDGRYVPTAEGKSADNEVRDLLKAESFGKRKGHDPQAWGLAQVLWAPQGEMAIGELSERARQSLHQALGAQIVGSNVHALEAKVEELYSRYFTAGGKYKSGATSPPIVGLEQELAAANSSLETYRTKLIAFNDASRKIEDLNNEAIAASAELKQLEEEVVRIRLQVDKYQELIGAIELCRRTSEATHDKFTHWDDIIKTLLSARQQLVSSQHALRQIEDDLPLRIQAVELQKQELDRARDEVERARAGRVDVSNARSVAALARVFNDARRSLAAIENILFQHQEADNRLRQLQKRRREIVSPDSKQLLEIRQAIQAISETNLRLEASSIALSITAQEQIELETLSGDPPGTHLVQKGELAEFRGAPQVAVRVLGIGVFKASGPTGSVELLRRQLDDAKSRLEQLTKGFGTRDIVELESRAEEVQELEKEIGKSQTRAETILCGKDIEVILGEQALATQQIKEVLDSHPQWNETPPNPESLGAAAEQIESDFVKQIDAAEDKCKVALEAHSIASGNLLRHESLITHAKSEIATAQGAVERLTADKLTDEERQRRLDNLAIEWRAAKAELERFEKELATIGSDPRPAQEVLQRQVDAVRNNQAEANRRLHIVQGNLQHIISEAPYSAVAAEEEKIAQLQEQIFREQLQLNAIRLLHDTFTRRKREIVESLVGPVCKRAEQTLSRIAGSRFERLKMTEGFELDGIVPRNVNNAVSLDQLSGGEREQVHFAVRLALADIAFDGQRQLVVLDDVFTYTDTARLARIVPILNEAADRFQVVLLTCHPERYQGLPNAKFFDLEQIASSRCN